MNQLTSITKKTRRYIFYISILLFLLVSYIVVRFSLGYGFDMNKFKFIKRGGISIVSNLASADVFLDDNFTGRTSVITNSLNKKNLLPGIYKIKVEKEGYKPYKKSAEVKPGEVVFILANLFKNSYEPVIFNEKFNKILAADSYQVQKIFRENNKTLVVAASISGSLAKDNDYFLLEEDSIKKLNIPSGISKNIEDILLRNNKIFLKTNNKIYLYSNENESVNLIADFYLDADIFNDDIYYLNKKDNFLYKKKIDEEDVIRISNKELNLPIGESPVGEKELKIRVFSPQLTFLLIDEKFLYRLKEDGSFEKFEISGQNLEISPDKKKLTVWDDKGINVFWLEEEFYPVVSKKYAKELVVRLSSKIEDVWWHKDSSNILFNTEGKLKVIEIDGTDGRNQFEIINNVDLVEYSEKSNDLIVYLDAKLSLIELD